MLYYFYIDARYEKDAKGVDFSPKVRKDAKGVDFSPKVRKVR
jgi:hypothetical protein